MDLSAGDFTQLASTGAQLAGGIGQITSGARGSSFNARIAKDAARQRLIDADIEVRQVKRLADQIRGKQEATIGASNLAISGSTLAQILDSAMQAELEKELIKRGAKIDVANIKLRGVLASNQARSGIGEGLKSISGSLANKNFTTIIQDLFSRGSNPLAVFDNPFEQGIP